MKIETFRFKDEATYTSTRFDVMFFANSHIIDSPESFIILIFHLKS